MARNNMFTQVALRKPPVNTFDLSHDVKMSFQIGKLIPSLVQECLPGDTFTIRPEIFLRFAPLVAPVMHEVDCKTEYFFIPNRILWPEWEDWITGNTDVEHPFVQVDEDWYPQLKSIWDYIGCPIPVVSGSYNYKSYKMNPLPVAAYYKVFNDYYRHQDLATPSPFDHVQFGPNTADFEFTKLAANVMLRGWEKDYLTSCLPTPQAGADPVQLPLTEQLNIPVEWGAVEAAVPKWKHPNTGLETPDGNIISDGGDARVSTAGEPRTSYDPDGTLTVDVQAGATTIERLRQAFRLQEFLEKTMRGGKRYIEQIWTHFFEKSSDARLQRPELIGFVRQRVVISEVLATAQSDNDPNAATVPVGQMAGHAISVGGGQSFRYHCEEHGWILGITSVIPRTAYSQGLPRHFSRFDRFDYAWPTFANLGEQEVKYSEVQAQVPIGSAPIYDPNATFGYQSRYADYKFSNSRIAGEFRENLAFWHMGRIFDDLPVLDDAFVIAVSLGESWERVFAVTDADSDHIYSMVKNNIYVSRKLPRFGIPTI